MKKLSGVLAILVSAILIPVLSGGTYVFPVGEGLVAVDIPDGWTNASSPESISFGSPDGSAALTVTAHQAASLTPEDVDQVIRDVRPFGLPTSEKKALKGRPAGSYRREFRGEGDSTSVLWQADFLFFSDLTVIASLNGPKEFFEKNQTTVRSILDSIQIQSTQKKPGEQVGMRRRECAGARKASPCSHSANEDHH